VVAQQEQRWLHNASKKMKDRDCGRAAMTAATTTLSSSGGGRHDVVDDTLTRCWSERRSFSFVGQARHPACSCRFIIVAGHHIKQPLALESMVVTTGAFVCQYRRIDGVISPPMLLAKNLTRQRWTVVRKGRKKPRTRRGRCLGHEHDDLMMVVIVKEIVLSNWPERPDRQLIRMLATTFW
jgi:hypothetical protein